MFAPRQSTQLISGIRDNSNNSDKLLLQHKAIFSQVTNMKRLLIVINYEYGLRAYNSLRKRGFINIKTEQLQSKVEQKMLFYSN